MMIDIAVSLKHGDFVDTYNNWNKRQKLHVKGFGPDPDAMQLIPDVRAIIPTGQTLEVPEGYIAKIYIKEDWALKKSLVLASCVQIVEETSEIKLIVKNTCDSLVALKNGDIIAHAILEKKVDIS